jgi:hypothetical protein
MRGLQDLEAPLNRQVRSRTERILMKREVTDRSAPTRELAQRLSGAVEILLLWQPGVDGVELSVRDLATGAGFHFEVEPGDAIDAFYHPYAYAASRGHSDVS